MNTPATSRDVARLAGVSQTTVSFVLTGRPGISEATRQRVLAAAEQLRYRPNLAARSMRTHRTGRLALAMPVNTWRPALLDGAVAAASEAGFALEVQSLPPEPDGQRDRLSELVDSGQFEGIVSFSPVPAESGGRTVVVAAGEFDERAHSSGESSDAAPLGEMMEHLVELGHRRFLHIAGPADFPSARSRRRAYEAAVARLAVESLGVVEGNWSGTSGVAAIRALPEESPPLAIIAANDLVATGAVRGAMERGWQVPEHVSVTGWDNSYSSAFQVPSLTTVEIDWRLVGTRALHRLIAEIQDTPTPPPTGTLQRIIWRESTGPAAPSHND